MRWSVPVPILAAPRAPTETVPALTVRSPLKVLLPMRLRLPLPVLVKPPVPVMSPAMVRLLPPTLMVRVPETVTAPRPRFRAWVPTKLRLPAIARFGEFVKVTPAGPVESNVEPGPKVTVPAPAASGWLKFTTPGPRTRPPEKVLAAPRVRLAVPILVTEPAPCSVSFITMLPEPPRFSGPLTLMLSLAEPVKVSV